MSTASTAAVFQNPATAVAEDEAGVDVSVTSAMAKEALARFQSRKYGECLELRHHLLQKKEDDPKRKQLARSSLEQAEAASISGTKGEFDVDDLINEFAENGLTTLSDMKRVWLSRKFSCIYLASPSDDLTLFMQTLYSQSIGYIVDSKSLSSQLGGLYCLYCLYKSQPFRPQIRIYISLSELRSLKDLVVSTKQRGIPLVCPLVKRMLEQNMFLFGFVDANKDSMVEMVDQLTELQNARVQHAYKKLFANTRIEHFLHTNLNEDIDLGSIKKMSTDYLTAKRLAIEEARAVTDVQSIERMATDKNPIGDALEGIANEWDSHKKVYYEQIGLNQIPDGGQLEQRLLEYHPQDEEPSEGDNVDDFEQELEQLLY